MRILSTITSLHKDLRILYISLLVWTFGLGLYNYVWSVYLRSLGATPDQVGLAFAIGYVAFAASMIPGAILSNRYDLRKVLIWSWALSIPAPIILLFARSWPIATIALVLLQGTSFGLPAYNAFIVANTDPSRVSSAFGSSYSAGSLGFIFSPLIGSVLLEWSGLSAVFILSFILFIISTMILLPIASHPAKLEDMHVRLELPSSSREVTILGFLAVSAFAFSLAFPFISLYFQDRYLLTLSIIQLLGAVYYSGSWFFSNLVGWRAEVKGGGIAMATGILLSALGLFGLIFVPSILFVVPLVFLFGAARAPSYVAYSLLSRTKREGSSRAGTYGFYLTIESFGLVIGSYLGGYLYSLSSALLLGISTIMFLGLGILATLELASKPTEMKPGSISELSTVRLDSDSQAVRGI